jgi:hypothetical protein
MPDKNNRTVAHPVAKAVYAVDKFFSAELEARLGGVRMPSRLVVVGDNSRRGHLCRQHVKVLEPVDVLFAALPYPRPVNARPQAVYGDDAATVRSALSKRQKPYSTSAVLSAGPGYSASRVDRERFCLGITGLCSRSSTPQTGLVPSGRLSVECLWPALNSCHVGLSFRLADSHR